MSVQTQNQHNHQFSFYNSHSDFLFSEDYKMAKSHSTVGNVQCEMPLKQERVNLRIKKYDRKQNLSIGIATKCLKRNETGAEYTEQRMFIDLNDNIFYTPQQGGSWEKIHDDRVKEDDIISVEIVDRRLRFYHNKRCMGLKQEFSYLLPRKAQYYLTIQLNMNQAIQIMGTQQLFSNFEFQNRLQLLETFEVFQVQKDKEIFQALDEQAAKQTQTVKMIHSEMA